MTRPIHSRMHRRRTTATSSRFSGALRWKIASATIRTEHPELLRDYIDLSDCDTSETAIAMRAAYLFGLAMGRGGAR